MSTDDDLERAFDSVRAAGAAAAPQHATRFKEKHSLDSDEEDVQEDHGVLDEDDIEGNSKN